MIYKHLLVVASAVITSADVESAALVAYPSVNMVGTVVLVAAPAVFAMFLRHRNSPLLEVHFGYLCIRF